MKEGRSTKSARSDAKETTQASKTPSNKPGSREVMILEDDQHDPPGSQEARKTAYQDSVDLEPFDDRQRS